MEFNDNYLLFWFMGHNFKNFLINGLKVNLPKEFNTVKN